MTDRRLGGLGALAFAVLLFIALLITSPVGGDYSAKDITSYTAHGHRAAIFISVYLVLLAVLGLVLLTTTLRELAGGATRGARILWATGLLGAAGFAIGWVLVVSVPIAMAYGGNAVTVDPHVTYIVAEAGWGVMFGVGGVLLGVTLVAFALARPAVAPAARWATLVAGILGIASLAWFPFFALLIWAVLFGLWLVVAGREPVRSPASASA